LKKSLCFLPVVLAFGCAAQPPAQTPTPKKSASIAQVNGRGSFMPTPLDGVRVSAKNVELQLPRGCEPLGQSAFVHVAEIVDDEDADFLGACNVVEAGSVQGKPRVTIVLMRHRLSLETGESAAAQLRRAPGVIDVVTTTAGPMIGQTMGPEVVLTTNLPTQAGARPSASVYFGAQDGLYVLYAEVDGDMESLAAWGDTLTSTLRPTASAKPIRWRAPTKLAPGTTAIGGHKIKLPEGIETKPKKAKTFGAFIGDPDDPLDLGSAGAMVSFGDESGIAVSGNAYRAKLLPKVADSPGALAKLAADVHHVRDLEGHAVPAKVGPIARVDGTRKDGGHEVFAAFEETPGEVVVLRLVFAKEKWPAYAPFIDASLTTLEAGGTDDSPYLSTLGGDDAGARPARQRATEAVDRRETFPQLEAHPIARHRGGIAGLLALRGRCSAKRRQGRPDRAHQLEEAEAHGPTKRANVLVHLASARSTLGASARVHDERGPTMGISLCKSPFPVGYAKGSVRGAHRVRVRGSERRRHEHQSTMAPHTASAQSAPPFGVGWMPSLARSTFTEPES
jgi:hypothetical protein